MKEILQQVKATLEKTYSNPNSNDLDQSIKLLQEAKESYGDKGTMIEDVIRSLTQAKHAQAELAHAGDLSSTSAFGEAFNSLEQAIESYRETNNDPF